jgi:hypothetical protein
MSKSNTLENDILKLMLQGTDPSWRASGTQYVALFTDDPTDSGSIANEATYTGYARVAVTKATAWTDSGSTFSNAALIQFGQCSAGTNAITHFAVVDTASGAVNMMISGALSATLNVTSGIQPQFAAGDLDITED